MATATKAAKHPVQELAMRAITVDHDLQSRVTTSVEYQREFSEAMLRGDEFPPITVFFDGKKYWMADGFHRFGAAKSIGRVSIRAEIHKGTRRDAIIYSAGANQEISIPRTREDKRKAVLMLMGDDEWFAKALSVIASHVGVSSRLVQAIRAAYCQEVGKALPQEVETASGRRRLAQHPCKRTGFRARAYSNNQGGFITTLQGKTHYLGTDCEKANDQAAELASTAFAKLQQQRTGLEDLGRWLLTRGVFVNKPGNAPLHGMGQIWLGQNYIVAVTQGGKASAVPEVVGRVLLNQAKWMPAGRAIVCHVDLPKCEAQRVAESMGIEFMTPDELVDSVLAGKSKADAEEHGTVSWDDVKSGLDL